MSTSSKTYVKADDFITNPIFHLARLQLCREIKHCKAHFLPTNERASRHRWNQVMIAMYFLYCTYLSNSIYFTVLFFLFLLHERQKMWQIEQ